MQRAVGFVAVVVFVPIAVVFGVFAALFMLNQFVSGWIPSRWFSSSPLDWAFGAGTEGSASNYVGFIVCSVPAYAAYVGARWGLEKMRIK